MILILNILYTLYIPERSSPLKQWRHNLKSKQTKLSQEIRNDYLFDIFNTEFTNGVEFIKELHN
jgi:hypothetical protein